MPKIPTLTKEDLIVSSNVEKLQTFLAKPKPPKNFLEHKARWENCTLCSLCNGRSKVVLLRGKVPCTVLVVGVAPGGSENVSGKPFTGDIGSMLNELISVALSMSRSPGLLSFAMTNLVACIPKNEEGKSIEPSKESLKACTPRLQEIVNLTKPKAIIMAGKLSQKMCPTMIDYDFKYSLDIIHPSVILRLDASQYPLAVQRTTVSLRDMFNQITEDM